MIGTQGEHDAEASSGLERHEKIDERSALCLSGFGQELLELIHDQEGLGLANWQIAANCIGGPAALRGVDALAQGRALVRGPSEPLRSLGHASPQSLDRVPAG